MTNKLTEIHSEQFEVSVAKCSYIVEPCIEFVRLTKIPLKRIIFLYVYATLSFASLGWVRNLRSSDKHLSSDNFAFAHQSSVFQTQFIFLFRLLSLLSACEIDGLLFEIKPQPSVQHFCLQRDEMNIFVHKFYWTK